MCVGVEIRPAAGEDSRESCRPTIYKSHCPTFYRRGGLLKHQVSDAMQLCFCFTMNSLSSFFFFEGQWYACAIFRNTDLRASFFLPVSSPTVRKPYTVSSTLRRRKGKCLRHSSVESNYQSKEVAHSSIGPTACGKYAVDPGANRQITTREGWPRNASPLNTTDRNAITQLGLPPRSLNSPLLAYTYTRSRGN